MTNRSQALRFDGAHGVQLSASLDLPRGQPRAYALFAHCFTCSKANTAAVRIGRALSELGYAVLRFDFTGLGASEGEFADTNFSSNVDDLVAAANHLTQEFKAPSLLIGHSLGGAAALAAASRMPELKAVATLNAPFDPAHVTHLFDAQTETIEREGEARVSIAGRSFCVRQHFLDDISQAKLSPLIAELGRALLVLHAPGDNIVGLDNARQIFEQAKHPKSFISLDGADHLLSSRADAEYVATTLAAWAARYLPPEEADAPLPPGEVLVQSQPGSPFLQELRATDHRFWSDEPNSVGGDDRAPTPYDLLLGALGACTSMTCRMYATRKGIALTGVRVTLRHSRVHAQDCAECEADSGLVDVIERDIVLEGELSQQDREKLLAIADKCPVHRTLRNEIRVVTRELRGGAVSQ